ncbi:MAG: DMT family transporter [Xanthomonadaceae bacterium]|jgi:drug/metabolite transporter (DMT)-like permease|nr:DMT family transporter [Xanthomonadaceae bacterium]
MSSFPVPIRAALLMAGSTLFFSLMAISIRLASESLHPFEIAFFRNLFGSMAALPLLLRHSRGFMRTQQLPRYLFRCVIGVCSMLAGFWAISNLPLAQAISLSYSTPLFATIAAAIWLGETVRIRRWTAVIVGFIGVLLIVRPGAQDFSTGSLIALLGAVLSSIVTIQIKQLSTTEPPDRIVIYTTLLWIPMSLLPALGVWRWPEGIAWLWIITAGMMGTAGHMLWTRALHLGEVSALTPIGFLQLPLLVLVGWLLFDEALTYWILAGGLIIIAANIYIARREMILAKQAMLRQTTLQNDDK